MWSVAEKEEQNTNIGDEGSNKQHKKSIKAGRRYSQFLHTTRHSPTPEDNHKILQLG
jgi:hypothetical protein